jgi:hypothetical protein
MGDPPQLHPRAPAGVFWTDPACYDFIGECLSPDARTLETGCGVSTVLFALWAGSHTCVVHAERQAQLCRLYLDERGIAHQHVRFEVGASEEVLPALALEELDLVLVDGGHGFPTPILDWYYGAGHLRAGGVVVLDDVQLPSVRLGLMDFLDADPRWEPVRHTPKWAAFRRLSSGSLREDWTQQDFLGAPTPARRGGPVP